MATFKYFSDIAGESIRLFAPHGMPNAEFAKRWPGVRGMRDDGFTKLVGYAEVEGVREVLPVTRRIQYKANPSKHECNAKCLNGSPHGICECRCGGANHGRGSTA